MLDFLSYPFPPYKYQAHWGKLKPESEIIGGGIYQHFANITKLLTLCQPKVTVSFSITMTRLLFSFIIIASCNFHSLAQKGRGDVFENRMAEFVGNGEVYATEEMDDLLIKIARWEDRWGRGPQMYAKVFHSVHRKFLKRYVHLASANELFEKGYYNCLTATALYGSIFEEMGIAYSITETPSHIYLKVYDREGTPYLLETTDPVGGFQADREKIAFFDRYYVGERTSPISFQDGKENTGDVINDSLTLSELAGLHHYNLSVRAFFRRDHALAQHHLEMAGLLYPTYRIPQLQQLMDDLRQSQLALNTTSGI